MIKKALSKGVAYLKRNGFRGFCARLIRKAVLSRPVDYKKWLKRRQVSQQELARQQSHGFVKKVTFGIYIAEGLRDKNLLQRTLQSLKRQSYDNYTVINRLDENAAWPDYLMILESGITLEPNALFLFAENIEKNPLADLLYGDYDYFDSKGQETERPECTPQFDLYYLRSRNYIGNMFICSSDLARKSAVSEAIRNEEGSYAYLLRCAEQAKDVVRIPEILSHQCVKQSGSLKEMQALEQHYARMGIPARVKETKICGTYFTEFEYREQPLLSVIIPNKDYPQQLKNCVKSILETGGYDNLEILIVENNSTEKETFDCYEEMQKLDKRIRIINWKGAFHYSRINNDAVKEAKGEYLLFLNNDTRVKSSGCLNALMNIGRQDDVGAVGARLYYADETIQHAGVILGYGGVAGHALEGIHQNQYESYSFAMAVRQLSAVTAACMLVKREAFQRAEGFFEELRVAYNDIDLCMKIRKNGWKIIYCPQAELYHYESQTRGLEMTREKAERVRREQDIFRQRWKKEMEKGDPFYSPNLTLEKSDFSLKR